MKIKSLHYYAGTLLPGKSAASVHVAYMTQSLAGEVDEVTVFAKGDVKTPPDELATYYGLTTVPTFQLIPFNNRNALWRYLRRITKLPHPDLVLGRYVYPVLFAALRGVPVVYEVHAPATGYKRWFEALLLRHHNLSKLVAITRALADDYVHNYPFLANKVLILPDAANNPGDSITPRVDGALTVTYVGSWYPGRGVELIIEMAKAMPHMNFVAAGGQAEELLAMGLECPDNLQCLGYLPPAEVSSVLRSADILVAPYQTSIQVAGGGGDTAAWSSPMKFFEYMSHGKAIICSDLPVFHEVFEHGQNCLFVPPADLAGWCSALEDLERDRSLATKLGSAARQQFLQQHTWKHRAQRLLNEIAKSN